MRLFKASRSVLGIMLCASRLYPKDNTARSWSWQFTSILRRGSLCRCRAVPPLSISLRDTVLNFVLNFTLSFTSPYQQGRMALFWAQLNRHAELTADDTPIKELTYKISLTKYAIPPVVSSPYSVNVCIQWQHSITQIPSNAKFQWMCSTVLEMAYKYLTCTTSPFCVHFVQRTQSRSGIWAV